MEFVQRRPRTNESALLDRGWSAEAEDGDDTGVALQSAMKPPERDLVAPRSPRYGGRSGRSVRGRVLPNDSGPASRFRTRVPLGYAIGSISTVVSGNPAPPWTD